MLSGGEHEAQGFNGHVIGGMGSITQAMAAAVRDAGGDIRTSAPWPGSTSATGERPG